MGKGVLGRALGSLGALLLLVGTLALLPRSYASAAAAPPPVPPPAQVQLTPLGFDPQTVDLVVGQSVVFTNASGETRSIQAPNGIFDSGDIPNGGAFTVAIPDERILNFLSAGSTTFGGTLRVGPNGLGGNGSDLANDNLPKTTAPAEDPASFSQEERWGLIASRTTMLVAFADTATVDQINGLLTQIHGKISGQLATTGIVVITIADRPDKKFDDLKAALAILQASPAVKNAALDTLGDSPVTNPLPPAPGGPIGSGYTYQPFPGATNGAYGIEQARFPAAWNLFDAIKRHGYKVDLGIVDTGFDFGHQEFQNVPGGSVPHLTYVPACTSFVDGAPQCFPNPTDAQTQGHGTGTLAQMGGAHVGADPLAH
jgi:hypothetical protein